VFSVRDPWGKSVGELGHCEYNWISIVHISVDLVVWGNQSERAMWMGLLCLGLHSTGSATGDM
jgi:hypothetical protein